MTRTQCRAICTERLDLWKERLVQSHATPFMLLGFAHDHRSGIATVQVCEGTTNEQIITCLRGLLRLAEEKLKREEQDKQSCS